MRLSLLFTVNTAFILPIKLPQSYHQSEADYTDDYYEDIFLDSEVEQLLDLVNKFW